MVEFLLRKSLGYDQRFLKNWKKKVLFFKNLMLLHFLDKKESEWLLESKYL